MKPPNHDWEAYTTESVCLHVCVCLCFPVTHVSLTTALNMQTSPCCPPGSTNTVSSQWRLQSSLGLIQALSIKTFQTWFSEKPGSVDPVLDKSQTQLSSVMPQKSNRLKERKIGGKWHKERNRKGFLSSCFEFFLLLMMSAGQNSQ